MKIVVMCENLVQFYDYVKTVTLNENSLPVERVTKKIGCSIITTHIEDVEFIYCSYPNILKGRSLSKNDRLIRIGSWYNIQIETREAIVAEFRAGIRT